MESNYVNTFRDESTSLRVKVFFNVFYFMLFFLETRTLHFAKLGTVCFLQKGSKRL
jgi:hypothetical protein